MAGGTGANPDGGAVGDDLTQYERDLFAKIKPQSTKCSRPDCATWVGVTKDTIKFAIAYDEAACGVNTLTLAQQASANLASSTRFYRGAPKTQEGFRAEFREAVKQIVEIVNLRALEAAEPFPEIRKYMGNDPTHPLFGRRIAYQLVDGGSYQCEDTARAAAVKIRDDIKPFVVVNNDALSRAGFIMASQLAHDPGRPPPDALRHASRVGFALQAVGALRLDAVRERYGPR